MTAYLKSTSNLLLLKCPVEQDIRANTAWQGSLSGLKAEKMLRGYKTPYLYVLREGENDGDYYVTFILPDLTISHRPFIIGMTETGWYYENTGGGPISAETNLEDILYLIMHCQKGECFPLIS